MSARAFSNDTYMAMRRRIEANRSAESTAAYDRIPVFVSGSHALSDPDRPRHGDENSAARSFLANAVNVLTAGNKASAAYWSELQGIVTAGRNSLEHNQAYRKIVDENFNRSLSATRESLTAEQIDALTVFSSVRAIIRHNMPTTFNDRTKHDVTNIIIDKALERVTNGKSLDELKVSNDQNPRNLFINDTLKSDDFKDLSNAISIVYKGTANMEDVLDIAPMLASDDVSAYYDTQDMSNGGAEFVVEDINLDNAARRDITNRILNSAVNFDIDAPTNQNNANVQLAQSRSRIQAIVTNILVEDPRGADLRTVMHFLDSQALGQAPNIDSLKANEEIRNAITHVTALDEFKKYGDQVKTFQKENSNDQIMSIARSRNNDPMANVDIIMRTNQEAQVLSQLLDYAAISGQKLPSPENIQEAAENIRNQLSAGIYMSVPSYQLNNYPQNIPTFSINEETGVISKGSAPHPYWEQYRSGAKISSPSELLENSRNFLMVEFEDKTAELSSARNTLETLSAVDVLKWTKDENDAYIPEGLPFTGYIITKNRENGEYVIDDQKQSYKTLIEAQAATQQQFETFKQKTARTVSELSNLPENKYEYAKQFIGYVQHDQTKNRFPLSDEKMVKAPIFGEDSYKLKFPTVIMEGMQFYKNSNAIHETVAGITTANEAVKPHQRSSIIIVADANAGGGSSSRTNEQILKSATELGMPIVEVAVGTNSSRKTVTFDSGSVSNSYNSEKFHTIIDRETAKEIDLFSSEGQKMARGALIVLRPSAGLYDGVATELPHYRHRQVGWDVSQSLAREAIIFGSSAQDYNSSQHIRRSIENGKPIQVIDKDGKQTNLHQAFADAKLGAPRISDQSTPSQMGRDDFMNAINLKLIDRTANLALHRLVSYNKIEELQKNVVGFDSATGAQRPAVIGDLMTAARITPNEMKNLPDEQKQNIEKISGILGNDLKNFEKISTVENAVKYAVKIFNVTLPEVYNNRGELETNSEYREGFNVIVKGPLAEANRGVLGAIGDPKAIAKVMSPDIAMIGAVKQPESKALEQIVDKIVENAAKKDQVISTLDDQTGELVLKAADRHNANVLLIRESFGIDKLSDKADDALYNLLEKGKAAVVSTDLAIPGIPDKSLDQKARLKDMELAIGSKAQVVLIGAPANDLSVLAAAKAGQCQHIDPKAGRSVTVITPPSDVENRASFAGNMKLARDNGHIALKVGITSSDTFAHSSGGVTDKETGKFVRNIREQNTHFYATPVTVVASWSQPAKTIGSKKQAEQYVDSVARKAIAPMHSYNPTSLTSKAIQMAVAPDENVSKGFDWKERIKQIHENTPEANTGSIRVNSKEKHAIGM
jgi:hypothetical protein